jgi:hypothetical protein
VKRDTVVASKKYLKTVHNIVLSEDEGPVFCLEEIWVN